jgi:hypothetical protein
MELSIPVNQINTQNVYFVDKKRNIIVEGDFIKIVYSTDSYEMIGLYTTIEFNVHEYPQIYMNGGDESSFPKKIQLRDNRIVPLTFAKYPVATTRAIIEDGRIRMNSGNTCGLGRPCGLSGRPCGLVEQCSNEFAKNTGCEALGVRVLTGEDLSSKVNAFPIFSSQFASSQFASPYIIPPPIISPLSVSKEFFSECITPEYYSQPNLNPTLYMIDQSFQKGSSDSLDHSWTQIASRSSNVHVKRVITFDPFSQNNVRLIDRLCSVEREIIERYISEYCPLKTASYSLKNQLMSGTIKYHSENKEIEHTSGMSTHNIKEKCILKISGVWETTTNVGITMKFILLR